MISVNYLTPLPSLLILGMLSIVMLVTSDIYLLINYLTFTEAFVISLSVAGLIKLRFTQPNLPRPIKVENPSLFLTLESFLILLLHDFC